MSARAITSASTPPSRNATTDQPSSGRSIAIKLFDRAAEGRVAAQCVAPHAGELRPVARKYEGELAFPNPGTRDEERRRLVVEKSGERLRRGRRILRERDQPVRMMVAPAGGRPQQHRRPLGRNLGKHRAPVLNEGSQRCLGLCRDDQRRQRPCCRRFLAPGRSGQHDVGIGPAKPERVDAGVRPLGRLRRLDVANQPQVQRLERDFRVGPLAVDGGRDDFPIESERRLEQPGHT